MEWSGESDSYLNDTMWSVLSWGRSKRALCIKTQGERENGGTKSFQLTLKLIVVQIVFFSSIFYINWGIETLGIVINFLKYFLNYYVSVTEISTGNILFVTTWEFVSKTKAKNVRNKWTNYWEPRLAPGHKAPTIYLGFKTLKMPGHWLCLAGLLV